MTAGRRGGTEGMEAKSEIVEVKTFPFPAGFDWAVGQMMQRFIETLAKRRILGAKCPACGYTYAPPRARCGRCYSVIEEKDVMDLSGKGTLLSYTEAHVAPDGNGNLKDLEKPMIVGAVKLEGADSVWFMPVEGVKPEDLKVGLAVKVRWRDETKGAVADICCFEPVA
jgi:uncharacterized OB-fold protein